MPCSYSLISNYLWANYYVQHSLSFSAPSVILYLIVFKCRNAGLSRHLVSPVPEWKKGCCRNRSTTGIRGPSPVPEWSGTELRCRMPECRCPAMMKSKNIIKTVREYLLVEDSLISWCIVGAQPAGRRIPVILLWRNGNYMRWGDVCCRNRQSFPDALKGLYHEINIKINEYFLQKRRWFLDL